LLVDLLITKEL